MCSLSLKQPCINCISASFSKHLCQFGVMVSAHSLPTASLIFNKLSVADVAQTGMLPRINLATDMSSILNRECDK